MVAKVNTENSTIIFSIKGFIGVITAILTIFLGFYYLAIQPRFEATDFRIEKIIESQNVVNKELNNSVNTLNINIATLSESIKNMKEDKK